MKKVIKSLLLILSLNKENKNIFVKDNNLRSEVSVFYD